MTDEAPIGWFGRVPKHPGGSLIFVKAGQDSTQLFDSYHPLYVRYVLPRKRNVANFDTKRP